MKITLDSKVLPEDYVIEGIEFLEEDDKAFIQIEQNYVEVNKEDLLRVLKALI